MRTTVTLDKDVERLLRDTMHKRRASFKETLNQALRLGLGGAVPPPGPAKPFVVKARALGLKAGLDPAGFNRLTDDLEVDAFLAAHPAKRTRR